MARTGARSEEGAALYERAIALFESVGATHPAARVSARLAEAMWDHGRLEHGLEIMDRSFELLTREEPDDDLGALAAQLGRFMFFAGQHDVALQRIETALEIAEDLSLPEVLSQALTTKGFLLTSRGRRQEGRALIRLGLSTALENDKPSAALRAYYNLADELAQADRYDEAVEHVREGLAYARRVGNRYWEGAFLGGQTYPFYAIGAWDEALELIGELPQDEWRQQRQAFGAVPSVGVLIHVQRGDLAEAARIVQLFDELATSADLQERAIHACGHAKLLLAENKPHEALVVAERALELRATLGHTGESFKELGATAGEAALSLGDLETVEGLVRELDALPFGNSSQFLQAQSARFRAHLAGKRGDVEAEDRLFKSSSGRFREMANLAWLATVLLEHAESLNSRGRAADAVPLLTEAREVFERLGARPWLERADRVGGREQVPA
jgi:tetratricopeptide (TPR) repeat protein